MTTHTHPTTLTALRERLLRDTPLRERRLIVAGLPTTLLEGGDGPPIVLLHGPGEDAVNWRWVTSDLVTTHHVLAPGLPAHVPPTTSASPRRLPLAPRASSSAAWDAPDPCRGPGAHRRPHDADLGTAGPCPQGPDRRGRERAARLVAPRDRLCRRRPRPRPTAGVPASAAPGAHRRRALTASTDRLLSR